jgi:hypothetical protein
MDASSVRTSNQRYKETLSCQKKNHGANGKDINTQINIWVGSSSAGYDETVHDYLVLEAGTNTFDIQSI